jgi:Tfp pilus assembly protein PilP
MSAEPVGSRSAEPVGDNPSAITILKPKNQSLPVTRDPFKPLMKPKKNVADTHALEQQQENDLLMGMRYLGMVKFGETFSALMHTENGRGVYQVNDQVNGLTITAIDEGGITFTKGNKTLKLQRGDL